MNGTIGQVLVKEGQEVSVNQVLMTLDPESLPENTKLSQLKLAQMTSESALAEARQAVLDAQSTLDNAKYARENLDYKDQATIDNAYYEYVLAKGKYESAKADYENWADEDASDHYETDLAPYFTAMFKAQSEMDSKQYVYELYKSDSSSQTYAEYDNAVSVAQNKLLEAQNYLTAISGGDVPADATGEKLLNYYQTKLTVDSVNLRAPIAGIVAAIYDQAGILVSNNHPGVELIDRSELTVTISVDESDVILLKPDMTAKISVDVLPDLDLNGHVRMIEPVGKANNGVVYYNVVVVLDGNSLEVPITATVQVSIQVGDPAVNLTVPASAVLSDSSGEYVQVIENETTRRVDVVSGIILSDDSVIVTGALTVGQQVLTIQSTSSSSTNNIGGGGGFLGIGGGAGGPAPSGGGQMPGGNQP
jgi:multidrug efflux pump subunit AcrA (membrane-fusion protein)